MSVIAMNHPRITMYTANYCGYCRRAERLLASKGVTEIAKIDVDADPAERVAMMRRTDGCMDEPWPGEPCEGGSAAREDIA